MMSPLSRPHGSATADGRIPALDGLRGLAIVLVLLAHQSVLPEATAVDVAVDTVLSAGWVGVELFFVLSGFLITGILYDARGRYQYFRSFYARRALRIFPLYYCFLVFWLLLVPLVLPGVYSRVGDNDLWLWLYGQNLLYSVHGKLDSQILAITWSLAIEEQFYLIWPLVVLALGRVPLMRLCAALVVLGIVLRLLLVAADRPVAAYMLTPAHLDSLVVGSWLALARRGPGGLAYLAPLLRPLVSISLVTFVGLVTWAGGSEMLPDPMLLEQRSATQIVGMKWLHVLAITCLALAFGGLLVAVLLASESSLIHRVFESNVLRMFGKYSYAMYLFHQSVGFFIMGRLYRPESFATAFGTSLPGQIIFSVTATLVTLFLAWLSWHLLERRFLELKRYFAVPRSDERRSPDQSRKWCQTVAIAPALSSRLRQRDPRLAISWQAGRSTGPQTSW